MTVATDFVKITPKASEEVIKLVKAENNPEIGLRLAVKGGGCSGLSYDLQFTPKEEGDTIIQHEGFNVYMDAKSMIYLKGMALDYQDGLQGKGFVFVNPNATSTCGCGESFFYHLIKFVFQITQAMALTV
ncbi:MAG: iron-sulfur-binding protein [Nitrospina sp.]|nr:MAG: iron-sulfur-binding protein [Nitrospina sp.]